METVRWLCPNCETVVETSPNVTDCPECGADVPVGDAIAACHHDKPVGGCDECNYWEAVDYHYDSRI